MRHALIGLLFTSAVASVPASAAVNVSIGINVPTYPQLAPIPGYPVYYAPSLNANYFFYDGLYWVFNGDAWYESPWYNGPWSMVDPYGVPDYLLRVPVRYYHVRPSYFRGWAYDAPPQWGAHWGRSWEQRRAGWDRWDRRSTPSAAPLPTYQRQYSGNRYPRDVGQQAAIHERSYSYTPRDEVARSRWQERRNEVRSEYRGDYRQRGDYAQPAQRYQDRAEQQRDAEIRAQHPRENAEQAQAQAAIRAQQQKERQEQLRRGERPTPPERSPGYIDYNKNEQGSG